MLRHSYYSQNYAGIFPLVLIPGSDPAGPGGPTGTSLEGSAMVPSIVGNVDRPPSPARSGSTGDAPLRPHNTNPPTSHVAYLREQYRSQELSEEATSLMLKSWRSKTNKSYDSLFKKWHSWCRERSSDPVSGPVTEVAYVYFLASLHKEGYQYNSINSYRSAISSVHEKVDGVSVGQHPTVTRLLKGVFHDRPPLPRYSSTWNVQLVLDFLGALGKNEDLTLKHLTWKTVMLLALTRPSRSADFSQLGDSLNRKGWHS